MSLINEALKQASQVQPVAPQHPAPRAMGVLHHARHEERRPAWIALVVLPFALTVVLLLAAFFLREWWMSGEHRDASAEPAAPTAAAKTGTAPAFSTPTPSAAAVTAPTTSPESFVPKVEDAAPRDLQSNDGEIADASGTLIVEPAAPVAKPAPTFKLQGITYSAASSSALINGAFVFVGDEVNGATVAKIERQSVTLQFDGELKVLKMH
ncbi:MAG: hypothetical protein HY301_20655 [Verrucomicrobia bacterium]|nr:hypothetical protein [Verrucomicrobiota bacterium]